MIFFTSYLSLIFLDVPEMSKQKVKQEEDRMRQREKFNKRGNFFETGRKKIQKYKVIETKYYREKNFIETNKKNLISEKGLKTNF